MPKYIIERNIPNAGQMPADDAKAASLKSREVLRELGPDIQWQESYVTDDKIYCVYIAANPDLVREHARRSGFPADRISRVVTVLDPSSAE